MQSTTNNQAHFSRIPSTNIARSSFDRSCGLKTTFDASLLVPVFIDEALPGDTMSMNMSTFCRMATPAVPIMDNLYLDSFFFSVPIRLLWDNWQKFNGEQTSPGDSTDFMVPQMPAPPGGWTVGSLGDYFGLPLGVDITTSALFFRAYSLIFDEWFRDENLVTPYITNTNDGPDLPTAFITPASRAKRHDYFTSCLPWPQKGPAVTLPIGDSAPVLPTGTPPSLTSADPNNVFGTFHHDALGGATFLPAPAGDGTTEGQWDDPGLYVDLADATATTINELRQAFQIQKLYERDARGGTRYTEILRSHFGVISPDARLQRPEYLGGGSQKINVTPVPQTSASGFDDGGLQANTPQGNLAAYATSSGSGHSFTQSFTEHCIVMGLVNVRADLTYQRGIERMHSRQTRWDFYWPSLATIGEQAVLSREIYADGTGDPVDGTGDWSVFGYQERWAEYRYKPSLITGKFRSTDPESLDVWHLAQDFGNTRPTLSETFITENVPVNRVIAVQDEPQFLFDAFFDYKHARPMPTYSVPGMIDHF